MSSEIKVDTISEKTSANGVVIDGVTLKDSKIGGTITIPGSTGTMALTSDISSAGLVHISTDTFTNVSNFEKNSVFSATHDIYKIFITIDASNNANSQLFFEMRGGSSNVTSNYVGNRFYSHINQGSFTFQDTGTSFWYIADPGSSDPNRFGAEITLFNPASAEDTTYRSEAVGPYASAWYRQGSYGYNTNNTAYDGFNLNYSGTQITGKVSTYGLALS